MKSLTQVRFSLCHFVAFALIVITIPWMAAPLPPVQALTPGSAAPTPVYRWLQPSDLDWVSIADHGNEPTISGLQAAGYNSQTLQFYAYLIGNSEMVAVYRWWHGGDRDWVTIPEGTSSDADLQACQRT